MYLNLLILLPLFVAAEPIPAPVVLNNRAACNQDNCLRALSRYTASNFCMTYTTAVQTATSVLPTYATACANQPSRVSSACSCLITPTPTPGSCPTDSPTQVVQDPGFELPTPTAGFNEGPWTVAVRTLAPSAFGPSPQYDISGSLAHSGLGAFQFYGYYYNGNIQKGVGFNAVVTMTQTLSFCPSTQYNFSAFVGYWDDFDPAVFGTTITVSLDDTVIVPTQLTCSDFADCTLPAEENVFKIGYRKIQTTITTPAKTSGVLKLDFRLDSASAGNSALYATVLDDITLTRVTNPKRF